MTSVGYRPVKAHANGLYLSETTLDGALRAVENSVALVAPLCMSTPAIVFDFDDTLMHVEAPGKNKRPGSPYEKVLNFAERMAATYPKEHLALIVVTARPNITEQHQYMENFMALNKMKNRWQMFCLPVDKTYDEVRAWKKEMRAEINTRYHIIACLGDRPHDVDHRFLDSQIQVSPNSAVLAFTNPTASPPIGVVLDAKLDA